MDSVNNVFENIGDFWEDTSQHWEATDSILDGLGSFWDDTYSTLNGLWKDTDKVVEESNAVNEV